MSNYYLSDIGLELTENGIWTGSEIVRELTASDLEELRKDCLFCAIERGISEEDFSELWNDEVLSEITIKENKAMSIEFETQIINNTYIHVIGSLEEMEANGFNLWRGEGCYVFAQYGSENEVDELLGERDLSDVEEDERNELKEEILDYLDMVGPFTWLEEVAELL